VMGDHPDPAAAGARTKESRKTRRRKSFTCKGGGRSILLWGGEATSPTHNKQPKAVDRRPDERIAQGADEENTEREEKIS